MVVSFPALMKAEPESDLSLRARPVSTHAY